MHFKITGGGGPSQNQMRLLRELSSYLYIYIICSIYIYMCVFFHSRIEEP